MRIDRRRLAEDDGVVCFNGQPFTGIAYDLNKPVGELKTEYAAGSEVPLETSEIIDCPANAIILLHEPEGEEGADVYEQVFRHNGELLDGVRLFLRDDRILSETIYREGAYKSSFHYFVDGRKERLEFNELEYLLYMKFYESGALKYLRLSIVDTGDQNVGAGAQAAFGETGALSELYVSGKLGLKSGGINSYAPLVASFMNLKVFAPAEFEKTIRDERDELDFLDFLDQVNACIESNETCLRACD